MIHTKAFFDTLKWEKSLERRYGYQGLCVARFYQTSNNLFFDGRLPLVTIALSPHVSGKPLGTVKRFERGNESWIVMNLFTTPNISRSTLLHKMIHIAQLVDDFWDDHGSRFGDYCINARSRLGLPSTTLTLNQVAHWPQSDAEFCKRLDSINYGNPSLFSKVVK